MSSKGWMIMLASALMLAGLWLLVTNLPPSGSVTVTNVDPPGLPYTLVLLRTGPGRDYARVGFLDPGETATVIARDSAGGWLLLDAPRGWVSNTAGDLSGPIDSLPVSDERCELPNAERVILSNPENGDLIVMRMGPSDWFEPIDDRLLVPGGATVLMARTADGSWVLTDPHGWIRTESMEILGDLGVLPVLSIRDH